MKATLSALLALATLATATPTIIKRASTPTEVQILNFALTLEHIENNFYTTYLARFNDNDFTAAGFDPSVRGRIMQIGDHESEHVRFLTSALGSNAVKPCTYEFPVNNVKDFVSLSQVLEGVGVTAYAGAAQFLHTPAYLTAAAVILSTEYVIQSLLCIFCPNFCSILSELVRMPM